MQYTVVTYIGLNSLDDVNDVSEPTVLSSTSLSELKVKVSS